MFQSVRRALVQGVEKTWNTLASHTGDGKGDQLWDNETNLYRREILINGQLLGDNQDVEVRIEAVRKIGHLAYTGGQDAAKLAGMYIERMANYLTDARTPPPLRLQVVKSISELGRGHRDNVQTIIDMEIHEEILKRVRSVHDFRLVRWSCYTLVSLCSMSLHILKTLQSYWDDKDLKTQLMVISGLSWKAWPKNYAQVLIDLIGFSHPYDDPS